MHSQCCDILFVFQRLRDDPIFAKLSCISQRPIIADDRMARVERRTIVYRFIKSGNEIDRNRVVVVITKLQTGFRGIFARPI